MSLRRLHVLVSHLPLDSHTKQAMFGERVATWTPLGAQLHGVLHGLAVANWQRSGGKRGKPKEPRPPAARIRIDLPDDI
ncbi:hypothetical protein [Actinomadura sp. SCN-SB]|jgi:hypothetical protein|uniref:hypothetical protein n=1 Tax=Actinomadura sp. SCN-SB TaxID=3373092 RepID=UPI00375107C0